MMRADKRGKFCRTTVEMTADPNLTHPDYIAAVREHQQHLLDSAMSMAVLASELERCAANVTAKPVQ